MTLVGSASDPDGDAIIAWAWVVDQAPPGATWELRPNNIPAPHFTALAPGAYVILLVVTDEFELGRAPNYVTIRIRDNIPATAVATADKTTIRVGQTVCFDGSHSSDPEAEPLSCIWKFPDGTPPAFDEVSTCHLFGVVGAFDVGLQVTDERGAYEFDFVPITVLPPAAVPALPRSGLVALAVLLPLAGAAQISRKVPPSAVGRIRANRRIRVDPDGRLGNGA